MLAFAAFFLTLTFALPLPKPLSKPADITKPSEWDYENIEDWGDFPGFEKCELGTTQSPIDINDETLEQFVATHPNANISFSATTSEPLSWTLIHTGHVIQVSPNFETPQNQWRTKFHGHFYNLLQFHFHTPSEHHVQNDFYPMEVHFVHRSPKTGHFLVVGVFFKLTDSISTTDSTHFITSLVEKLPAVSKEGSNTIVSHVPVSVFLRSVKKGGHYVYNGSLTTPPCSEGIQWVVMRDAATMSVSQWELFKSITGFNARNIKERD